MALVLQHEYASAPILRSWQRSYGLEFASIIILEYASTKGLRSWQRSSELEYAFTVLSMRIEAVVSKA